MWPKQTPALSPGGHRLAGRPAQCQRAALEHSFALCLFASKLAGTPDGLGLLARTFFGRFLVMLLELHFAKHTLTLQLFLQGTKRLIDIVVTNTDLHVVVTTFLS